MHLGQTKLCFGADETLETRDLAGVVSWKVIPQSEVSAEKLLSPNLLGTTDAWMSFEVHLSARKLMSERN